MKNNLNFSYISLVVLLLIFFSSSCSKKSNDNLSLSPIFPNKISIDLDGVTDTDFKSYFSKIEIIPLETSDSSLIKICTKLYLDERTKNYYIFDSNHNNVLVYNSHGDFILNSRCKFGEGPEEYSVACDFFLNKQNQTLDFLDPRGYIFVYDLQMNFLRKLKIKNKIDKLIVNHYFMPLTKDIYVLYSMLNNDRTDLFFYSIDKESIIKEVTIPSCDAIASSHSEPFKFNANKFFFTGLGGDYVYQINPQRMLMDPYLELDYGKKKLKYDGPKTPENISILEDIILKQDYAIPGVVTENNIFIYIQSYCKGLPYFSFYNKISKKIETGCLKYSNNVYISRPDLMTNEAFYCILDPEGVKKCIPENVLNEENKNRMNALKEDDNPVIVKCYFKK